jgi:uncharacterized cupin superfamily protein
VDQILVEQHASSMKLEVMGVYDWTIWEKEVSEFPWTYEMTETCYFVEGEVIVTPDGGEPVKMGRGDLVIFPKGMSCTWKILEAVEKHYNLTE